MLISTASFVAYGLARAIYANAQILDPQLVGTWTTKSQKVLTGPGFYDPVNEKLIEPDLTGISYSFSDDGHYEEAYYRALANPTTPSCPKGMMQWQHGTYEKAPNGSLILTPISVDGRQLTSDPCAYDSSVYIRYNQSELFKSYEVLIDPYHNIPRLNLYKFDGSPMHPMYLANRPPTMLPTTTLHPPTSSSGQASPTTTSSKLKRALQDHIQLPLHLEAGRRDAGPLGSPALWWWIGVGMTGVGAVLYTCS